MLVCFLFSSNFEIVVNSQTSLDELWVLWLEMSVSGFHLNKNLTSHVSKGVSNIKYTNALCKTIEPENVSQSLQARWAVWTNV